MKIALTPTLIAEMEEILNKGNRVELAIENGKVAVIEIKRKLKIKE